MLGLALFQPDIPQNLGAAMRLCACLNIDLHVIEPCGFPFNESKIRRSGMDYVDHVCMQKHTGWERFQDFVAPRRIVLMTTKASAPYTDFIFQPDDVILMGRESAGVPDDVHSAVNARLMIPMHGALRSLNVVTAAAMILGEAKRQTQ